MKLSAIILFIGVFLSVGCRSSRDTISSSKADPVAERCAAINAQFTNGTPMSHVEAKLGQPDTMSITSTLSLPRETQNQRIWVYHFGSEDILIFSTGEPTTPFGDRGFAGARVVKKVQ
jgi:hypothetical protein